MPSIRIGFSTDFNLTSEQVGIGTTLPSARLDVAGQILSDNSSGSGGVSTVTRYDGFLGSEQRVTSNISIAQTTKGNLNSLSGEIVIEDEVTVTDDTPLTGGRLDSLTVTGKFDLPHGGTEDREDTPEKGSTRFNQDLGQLEFYTGYEWRTANSYDGSGRGRGVFGGGQIAPATFLSVIDYVNISSTGNALSFGTLSSTKISPGSCSSEIRGIFGGGYVSSITNVIDYITIASEGNAIDFGDLTVARRLCSGLSSSTRGLFGAGLAPAPATTENNTIDYIQISTLGNALDFGDMSVMVRNTGACASPTRGIFINGYGGPSYFYADNLQYITISSKGNTVDFGDSIYKSNNLAGCSNSIRGVYAGTDSPSPAPASIKQIGYITISTTGNSLLFGDLTTFRLGLCGSSSNSIRGLFAGGNNPNETNSIDYINLMTTGNAQDFGDLTIQRYQISNGTISDSHGGLGGF